MARISAAYFPNQKHQDLSSAFYASIFIRDVHTGIMPYKRKKGSKVEIKLSRQDPSLENELKDFLYVGQYSAWNFNDTITDSIENLAHYLAAFGEVYFEITESSDEAQDGVTGKSLELLPRGKIIKLFNTYVQFVPMNCWERGHKKFYFIPADRIWHLKLPSALGSPRSHQKLLTRLQKISETMPKFANKKSDLGQSSYYDFMSHHEIKEMAVEQITANWGSIPSLRQIKHTTEYYYVVRSLQFSHSQAIMREHILSEMNRLLYTLGTKNSIQVDGLNSSASIWTIIEKLHKGEVGFSDAFSAVRD